MAYLGRTGTVLAGDPDCRYHKRYVTGFRTGDQMAEALVKDRQGSVSVTVEILRLDVLRGRRSEEYCELEPQC